MRKKILLILAAGLILTGCGDVAQETKDALAETAAEENTDFEPSVFTYEKEAIDDNNIKYTKQYNLLLTDETNATFVIMDMYSESYSISVTYAGTYDYTDEQVTFTYDDPQDGQAATQFVFTVEDSEITEISGLSEENIEIPSDTATDSSVVISDVNESAESDTAADDPYSHYDPNFTAYGDYGELEFQINDDGTAMTLLTLDHQNVYFTGTYTVDGKTQRVCEFILASDDGRNWHLDVSYDTSDYTYHYSGEIQ